MANSIKTKIYMLGYIPKKITIASKKKFLAAQRELEKSNQNIFNPIHNLTDPNLKWEEAYQKNMNELLSADAVYLIHDVHKKYLQLEELRMAIKLNLIILHQPVLIDSGGNLKNIIKAKLKRHSEYYLK